MAGQKKSAKTKAKLPARRSRDAAEGGSAKASRKRNGGVVIDGVKLPALPPAVEGRGVKTGLPWWSTDRPKPYPGNAKTHTPEQVWQIASGIATLGFNNPILVDRDEVILAGHGRQRAAMALGIETVPVLVLAHLSKAEARRYRIEDNQFAMLTGWDEAALKRELLGARDEDEIDLASMGFDAKALAALFKSGDLMAGMIDPNADHDGNDAKDVPSHGVGIRFDMLPKDRDTVVQFLGQVRDRHRLRTSAEALVKIAKEGLKKK